MLCKAITAQCIVSIKNQNKTLLQYAQSTTFFRGTFTLKFSKFAANV